MESKYSIILVPSDLEVEKFLNHTILFGSTTFAQKIRLTDNVFPLTPALTLTVTLTLKHNNVFGLTK